MHNLTHMQSPEDLLSVGQITSAYGVSRRTVGRRIDSGELPAAHKLPTKTGAYLFRRDDVERVFSAVPSGAA